MRFEGFEQSDFDTFTIEGLDLRMQAIEERIRPKFHSIGHTLVNELSLLTGTELFMHIAKHARRTVNPPKDTWLAIAANKRGYKMCPHFQVGLFDDHVFIWLAFIYELPNKKEIAHNFLEEFDNITKILPTDFVLSTDHMKKESKSIVGLGEDGLRKALERFGDVKKAEFLIGRHIPSNDPILKDGDEFIAFVYDTFKTLLPLYTLSYQQK
ncbi:YktB family protein [Priestia megaterium]|uniref:YktB family protein n=1 Tax=Priestia megaterium TaxID=1404 RepID=UPI00366A86DE